MPRAHALTLLLLTACKGSVPATSDPAPVTSVTTPASGSPLSRLIPPVRPGPRATWPLSIESGVGFGPVLLGETLADLEHAGLSVTKVSDTHAEVSVVAGATLKVSLCEGKIIEIWIDDLRRTPGSVLYNGTPVSASIPREDLERRLGGCTATPPRIGGAFERCHDGGVYLGHGLGAFLQIRVHPKTFPFDNACALATDDGTPIALPHADRSKMLRDVLNLRELSPYWHVAEPGRDPLRIVRTALIPEQPLTMFGSPVLWIDESDAKKGTAFLRIIALVATKTRAVVTFEYPIEGVVGTATFAHQFDWRLERGEVREAR